MYISLRSILRSINSRKAVPFLTNIATLFIAAIDIVEFDTSPGLGGIVS